MENVFRGVQLVSEQPSTSTGDVVSLDVRTWLASTAISAVHVTVMDDEPDEAEYHASAPKRSR